MGGTIIVGVGAACWRQENAWGKPRWAPGWQQAAISSPVIPKRADGTATMGGALISPMQFPLSVDWRTLVAVERSFGALRQPQDDNRAVPTKRARPVRAPGSRPPEALNS